LTDRQYTRGPSTQQTVAVAAVILVAAALVRFLAARGDFWFDEIWTWSITLNLSSPMAVLTRIKHENNHFLNTWVIWLIGGEAHWIWYRVPAILAGLGTVALAGVVAGVRRNADRISAMLLVGGSYLCIHFSSEARGYAYVVFFSLLAVGLQGAALERRRAIVDAFLAVTLVLGMLSHLTFLYSWASILAWAMLRTLRSKGSWRSMLFAHAPPIAFSAWLYFVNVRYMTQGGGEIHSSAAVVLGAMSLSMGGPGAGPWAWLFAAMAAAVLITGVAKLVRAGSDLWALFACITVLAPAGLMLVAGRDLYLRYFLIAAVFLLLLGSRLLGDLWSRSSPGKITVVVALTLFLVANGVHTARLLRLGRGQYEAALQTMRAEAKTFPSTVGSDHDFRNSLIFVYYRRYLSSPRDLYFHTRDGWPPGGPEWFVRHSLATRYEPETSYSDPWGNDYTLAHVYPYAGLSGWNWAVYHNVRYLLDAPSR
jgi:hypothetical protein